MYFDFFNYTFSSIISFVTAVFGMSYPLLIESIQKIDDRYRSRHLKAKFENSIVFKLFNCFMLSSVIIAILNPFCLTAAFSNKSVENILISFQTIMLALLILQTFYLIKQIQLYNTPGRLLDYILQNATKSDLNVVLDIMRYIQVEDRDLYRKGMQWIVKLIIEENNTNGRV